MANWKRRVQVWWTVLRLRCPNCGQGRIFTGLFKMNPVCPVCGVRFERESGESVGGMYINLALAELITIGGFFIVNALFHPPFLPHLIFWAVFNVVFVALFYRHARSLWIGTTYLTGGVYKDAQGESDTPAA
jgi:uncharacterized protein (DUF983 family)